MSDCKPAKISISPGVANLLSIYKDKAEKVQLLGTSQLLKFLCGPLCTFA